MYYTPFLLEYFTPLHSNWLEWGSHWSVIFKGELDKLADFNIDFAKKLYVSKKAHLILPTHRLLDAASEAAKEKQLALL